MNRVFYILLFTLLNFSLPSAVAIGWNNGGGNAGKNGFVNTNGPVSDSVLWQLNSPGLIGSPIFIEGDYLITMRFFSLTNAPVECYDLTTGNLIWSADVTGSAGRSLPVGLRDGRVYVVRYTESQNDSLFALDVVDGSRLWTSNVNVNVYITETGVFDAAGDFYIYASNFRTVKINPTNGQMIWQTPTVPIASGSGEMVINNSSNKGYTLEVIGGVSYLWAIDLATGQKLYNHIVPDLQPGGNVPQSALMVGLNGVVYVHLTQDNIASFKDAGTLFNLNWQTEITGNSAFSLMCMGADSTIYVPSDNRIIRLDPLTGDTLSSSIPITQGGFFSPRISAADNNMIYATNGEDYVYAFDLQLNLLWSDYIPNNNTSGVCIAPNGLAAVCGQNIIKVYSPLQPVGMAEADRSFIQLYPNPVSTQITLEIADTFIGEEYVVMDAFGRIVITGKAELNKTHINLAELTAGFYFLKFKDNDLTYKIIRQ